MDSEGAGSTRFSSVYRQECDGQSDTEEKVKLFSCSLSFFFEPSVLRNAPDSASLSGLVERKLIIHTGSQRSINAGTDTAERGEEEERSPL